VKFIVLDASVAAKWFLPAQAEPLLDQAVALLQQYEKAEVAFIVPDLFWSEIANVTWKAVLRGRLTSTAAYQSLEEMRKRRLSTFPALGLLDEALAIALAFQRSVYDSLYVALAVESKSTLITADEKLANALAAELPVKWLGAVY
jgi:predicted nucleic acid-binding protein